MTTKTSNAVRFFWNGLKVGKGALLGAHFTYTKAWTAGTREIPEHLSIYFTDYDLPAEVVTALTPVNNSNMMTDYFEKSHAMITRSHPLWSAVLAAYVAQEEKAVKRTEARAARNPGYRRQAEDARRDLALAQAVRS